MKPKTSNDRKHDLSVMRQELPDFIRGLFTPDTFRTHLKAFMNFKMGEEQTAKELANLCNLIVMRLFVVHSKPADFTQTVSGKSSVIYECLAPRVTGARLSKRFRGRVIETSLIPEEKPKRKLI